MPAQLPVLVETGVTIMVAVFNELVLLTPTKDAIFPVPLAASPMDVLLFVQLKEVALPLKFIAVVFEPAHIT